MQYSQYSTLCSMAERKPRTFGQRIEYILEEEKLSQAAFARLIEATPQKVAEWISGRTKNPVPEALFNIEDKLGYSARWLATGAEPIKVKKLDPTESVILESLEKLNETSKHEVEAFIEFQLTR
jgi:transcriptional regulator with XRE-family HTH domain